MGINCLIEEVDVRKVDYVYDTHGTTVAFVTSPISLGTSILNACSFDCCWLFSREEYSTD